MCMLCEIREFISSNTFVKFCLIGIVNGIVGFSIILSLIYGLGVNYLVSNFIGYACGLTTSFFLNKYLNFKSGGRIKVELPVFFGSFVVAYSINALTLYILVDVLLQSKIVGLVIASSVYTVLFYLSSRFFVFIRHH